MIQQSRKTEVHDVDLQTRLRPSFVKTSAGKQGYGGQGGFSGPVEARGPRGFSGLGIAPKLLEILASLKFQTPTPIQHKAIPVAIEGKDIIGIAQTGTGKTLAFGIPLIQRIMQTGQARLPASPKRGEPMRQGSLL